MLNGIDTALSAWERGLPLAETFVAPGKFCAVSEDLPVTRVDRIRTLTGRAWRPQDVARIEKLTAVLTEWASDIGALLDPPSRMHLSAACPVCAEAFTHRMDRAGELVRVPVLSVDAVKGAECLACEAYWPPMLFEHLSTVLDAEPVG
ncbi:MAG: DUF7340 domain-containing protein [Mycobacterium sp.]